MVPNERRVAAWSPRRSLSPREESSPRQALTTAVAVADNGGRRSPRNCTREIEGAAGKVRDNAHAAGKLTRTFAARGLFDAPPEALDTTPSRVPGNVLPEVPEPVLLEGGSLAPDHRTRRHFESVEAGSPRSFSPVLAGSEELESRRLRGRGHVAGDLMGYGHSIHADTSDALVPDATEAPHRRSLGTKGALDAARYHVEPKRANRWKTHQNDANDRFENGLQRDDSPDKVETGLPARGRQNDFAISSVLQQSPLFGGPEEPREEQPATYGAIRMLSSPQQEGEGYSGWKDRQEQRGARAEVVMEGWQERSPYFARPKNCKGVAVVDPVGKAMVGFAPASPKPRSPRSSRGGGDAASDATSPRGRREVPSTRLGLAEQLHRDRQEAGVDASPASEPGADAAGGEAASQGRPKEVPRAASPPAMSPPARAASPPAMTPRSANRRSFGSPRSGNRGDRTLGQPGPAPPDRNLQAPRIESSPAAGLNPPCTAPIVRTPPQTRSSRGGSARWQVGSQNGSWQTMANAKQRGASPSPERVPSPRHCAEALFG